MHSDLSVAIKIPAGETSHVIDYNHQFCGSEEKEATKVLGHNSPFFNMGNAVSTIELMLSQIIVHSSHIIGKEDCGNTIEDHYY